MPNSSKETPTSLSRNKRTFQDKIVHILHFNQTKIEFDRKLILREAFSKTKQSTNIESTWKIIDRCLGTKLKQMMNR